MSTDQTPDRATFRAAYIDARRRIEEFLAGLPPARQG